MREKILPYLILIVLAVGIVANLFSIPVIHSGYGVSIPSDPAGGSRRHAKIKVEYKWEYELGRDCEGSSHVEVYVRAGGESSADFESGSGKSGTKTNHITLTVENVGGKYIDLKYLNFYASVEAYVYHDVDFPIIGTQVDQALASAWGSYWGTGGEVCHKPSPSSGRRG